MVLALGLTSHLNSLQGQSEQTYSTVKTGEPAVTVTNLKPATRYVFQVRTASLGPSWETQSFSPSIEVQTPGEGKECAWTGPGPESLARGTGREINCVIP
jgi:hypothetical protein